MCVIKITAPVLALSIWQEMYIDRWVMGSVLTTNSFPISAEDELIYAELEVSIPDEDKEEFIKTLGSGFTYVGSYYG